MIVLFLGVWITAQSFGAALAMDGQINWVEGLAPSLFIVGLVGTLTLLDMAFRAMGNLWWQIDTRIGITAEGRYIKGWRKRDPSRI